MICPNCNHTQKNDFHFCTNCGAELMTLGGQAAEIPLNSAASSQTSDPLLGQILNSKYELISELGHGGMATVYRARRVRVDNEVAVKVLNSRYAGERDAIERFKREARAVAKLDHPNVVVLHDFDEAPAMNVPVYIVMELLAGESLGDIIRRESKLSPDRILSLFNQICAGVGAAHKRNIIHRDLKPDNIIVLPPENEGDEERVKVVDFGIAKLRDEVGGDLLTHPGTVLGTPLYMSPEQCRGEELEPQADVYSLGVILYEMLTGKPPFEAPNRAEIIAKHLNEPPPSLSGDPNLPRSLVVALDRALAKLPANRPADATELYREVSIPSTEESPVGPRVGSPRVPTLKMSGEKPLEIATDTPFVPQVRPGPGKRRKVIASVIVVLIVTAISLAVWRFRHPTPSVASQPGNERQQPANANLGVTDGSRPTGDSSPIVEKLLGTWHDRTGALELRFQESQTGLEGVILKVPDVWPANRVKIGESVFAKGKVVGDTIEGLYINLPQNMECPVLETRYSKCVISFESDGVMKVTNSAWQYASPECKWSLETSDNTWNWYKK